MTENHRLVTPTVALRESFLAALAEYHAEGRHHHLDINQLTHDFAAYITKLAARANPNTPHTPRRVPSTTYWYTNGADDLGRLSIRHYLTPAITHVGHIGYDVRPTARRQAHATHMLGLALPHARQLGINQALVTCRTTNTASRKVIEKNGGILEREEDGRLYYWITT